MKLLHIPAKSNVDIKLSKEALKKLPKKKLGIVTTIQYLHKLSDVEKQLPNCVLLGQILGCNVLKTEKAVVDAFLYIGTGEFHPKNLALKTGKAVYVWNPVNKSLKQLPESDIDKEKKRIQGLLNKFLHAKTLGIIVSLKPGQFNLKLAEHFSKKKNAYIFLCNNVNTKEFENFPFTFIIGLICFAWLSFLSVIIFG